MAERGWRKWLTTCVALAFCVRIFMSCDPAMVMVVADGGRSHCAEMGGTASDHQSAKPQLKYDCVVGCQALALTWVDPDRANPAFVERPDATPGDVIGGRGVPPSLPPPRRV